MDNNQNRTRTILYGVIIVGGVALALYFIVGRLFPQMISKFTTLLMGLLVFVTGMFLRKKRS